ncbi:hypothetical protein [Patulibacter defluvii]|uniref:hypothetical protein n=1 Tax=Patulibacter defluvii TaxID=3095358 RepID=UPI002A762746|nr:hypothetical protein [Patulibacter sp. DM4]
MSKTTMRASLAAVGAVTVLALVPGGAQAAFDTNHDTQCENATSIQGRGASFQRSAQLGWGAEILAPNPGGPNAVGFGYATTANGGCAQFKLPADGGSQKVRYAPTGSGSGRAAFGATATANQRDVNGTDGPFIFGGVDEAPSDAGSSNGGVQQLENANAGDTSTSTDNATLHTIPIAQSSVAVDVRIPDGCEVVADPADRRITATKLERAFAAASSADTWGEILPSIAGSAGGLTTAQCQAKPVVRVVRFDSSGTTFAFKRLLQKIATRDSSGTTWSEPTLGNTAWPSETAANLKRPTTNGAGAQLDLLAAQTDGGIAYADLATSRTKLFGWDGTEGDQDRKLWLYVEQPGNPTPTFRSPAVDDDQAGTKGSNCGAVAYGDKGTTTLPTNTTKSWYDVDATSTTVQYPGCALTYGLAWQTPQPVNVGITDPAKRFTQDQARAVKDYLAYVLNTAGGQSVLAANDYQALPTNVRTAAQTGVGTLNW